MSKRADRQVRYEMRDGARLRFLIRCMSDAELHRLGLVDPNEDRPNWKVLLKRVDGKMQVFEQADRRLRRSTVDGEPQLPQSCKCMKCGHVWTGFFLPKSATELVKIMGRLSCLKCHAGPKDIKPVEIKGVGPSGFVVDEAAEVLHYSSTQNYIDAKRA